jgi:glycosyltransferase involved in cell wall biosynthesis
VKIALDIRRLGSFGIGTYIRNVVRTLARIDARNQYLLLGYPERLREVGELPPNFSVLGFPYRESETRSYYEFGQALKAHGCDLAHVPHLFWHPRYLPCRYVVTVHDLLTYMRPRPTRSFFRRTFHPYLTRRALKRAERIFAVSNFTKSELTRTFGIPGEKIEVVYNAIDERFQAAHTTEADRQFIAERFQVNYPFLLYAGNVKPHKNVVRTIEAFSALKGALQKTGEYPELKLIIIGDELSKHPDLRRTVVKSAVEKDVRFLGFVPIEVLRTFYATAEVFIFPSLYEGFGLPPLEAMSLGTPVVTSNTSSLPEVVDGAAVLVNPENVFEIMRAVQRVLRDQPLREKLRKRGQEQAKRYSWEKSVRRILEVYEEVGAGAR